MSEAVIDVYKKQFEVAAHKVLEQTQVQCFGVQSDAIKAGMLNSSRTALMLVDVIKGSEAILAEIALRTLLKCYSKAGIKITSQNSGELKDLLTSSVCSLEQTLRSIIYSKPLFKGNLQSISVDDSNAQLDEAREIALKGVRSEIDLLALSKEHTQESNDGMQQQYVFNGPVQQVIAGTGNTGTMFIEDKTKDDLVAALNSVIADLEAGGADGDGQALAAVANDAVTELEKTKPNRFKLSGLLNGLDKGLSIVPKARTAYEVLRGIAAGAGLL